MKDEPVNGKAKLVIKPDVLTYLDEVWVEDDIDNMQRVSVLRDFAGTLISMTEVQIEKPSDEEVEKELHRRQDSIKRLHESGVEPCIDFGPELWIFGIYILSKVTDSLTDNIINNLIEHAKAWIKSKAGQQNTTIKPVKLVIYGSDGNILKEISIDKPNHNSATLTLS